jgi:hypothetical protein
MPPMGFEPTISAGERPQTDALNHPVTGTGGSPKLSGVFVVVAVPVFTCFHFSSEDGDRMFLLRNFRNHLLGYAVSQFRGPHLKLLKRSNS